MPIAAAPLPGEFAAMPERGRVGKELVVITGTTGAAQDTVVYTSQRFSQILGAKGIGYSTIAGNQITLVCGEALANNSKIVEIVGLMA
jgi:hypothetical protein